MKNTLDSKNLFLPIGIKILGDAIKLDDLMAAKLTYSSPDSNGVSYCQGVSLVEVDGTKLELRFTHFFHSRGQEYYRNWQKAKLLVFNIDDEESVSKLKDYIGEWDRYSSAGMENLFIVGLKSNSTEKGSYEKAQKTVKELNDQYGKINYAEIDPTKPEQLADVRKAIGGQALFNYKKLTDEKYKNYFGCLLEKWPAKEKSAAYQTGMVMAEVARNSVFPKDIIAEMIKHMSVSTEAVAAIFKGFINGLRVKQPFGYDAVVKVAKDLGGLKEDPTFKKGIQDYLEHSVSATLKQTPKIEWKSHIGVKDVHELYGHCKKKPLLEAGITDKYKFAERVREEEQKQKEQKEKKVTGSGFAL